MFSFLCISIIFCLFVIGSCLGFIFIITLSFFLPDWCYYKPLTDMFFRRVLLLLRWFYRLLKPLLLQLYNHPRMQALLHACWNILVIIFYKLYRYFIYLEISRFFFIRLRFSIYYKLWFIYWAIRDDFYYPCKRYLKRSLADWKERRARNSGSPVFWLVGYPFWYFIHLFRGQGYLIRYRWSFVQFTYTFVILLMWFFLFFQFLAFFYNSLSSIFFFFGFPFNDAFFVAFFSRVIFLFYLWFVYSLGRMGFFIYLRLLRRRRREVNFFYFFICFIFFLFFLVYIFYNGFMDFYYSGEKLWGKPSFWRPIVFFFFFFVVLNVYSYIAYRCYCMECWFCLLEKKEKDLPIGYLV